MERVADSAVAGDAGSVTELKRELAALLVDSAARPDDRDSIVNALQKIPAEFLAGAVEMGGRIRPLGRDDKYSDVSKALRDLGAAGVDTWAIPPAGLYVVSEKTMYLRVVTEMTAVHEFGHMLDHVLGRGNMYASNSDPTIASAFNNATAFVTPYAAAARDEFVAEALRAYCGANDSQSLWPKVSPERLMQIAPEMTKFFDDARTMLRQQQQAIIEKPVPTVVLASVVPTIETAETATPPKRAVKEKTDYRQEITDKMIAALENGTAPWQKGWEGGEVLAPLNPTTGKRYRGGNIMRLLLEDRADPRWMTYKQAEAGGWQVKAGSKGTRIEYWDFSKTRPGDDDKTKDNDVSSVSRSDDESTEQKDEKKSRPPRVFYSVIFNAEQIDGIPPLERNERDQQWTPTQDWQQVRELLTNAGIDIKFDGNGKAFFNHLQPDAIHLPEERLFKSETDLSASALHEASHWSGHQSKLGRHDEDSRFGNASYAREELVAEMSAALMAATLGIARNLDNNASYVRNWIEVLKDDKNEIFRASSEAQRATDFIFARALERANEIADEAARAQPIAIASSVEPKALSPIADLPVVEPAVEASAVRREDLKRGVDQALTITGRSEDGDRVFAKDGRATMSLIADLFTERVEVGAQVLISRGSDGRDVIRADARDLVLER